MKENEMVFGIRAVIEAIQADKEVDKILVKRDLQGDLSKELFEVLRGREIPVQRVPAERLMWLRTRVISALLPVPASVRESIRS